MALFSISDHAMASTAIRAREEASGPVRKFFCCDGHVSHDGDSDHLWRNFPQKHVPGIAAAWLKRINVWYNTHFSTSRDTCRIGDSAFAASVQNKGTAIKGGSSEQKYLPTKKRYLSLLGFMMPSHARAV